MASLIEAIEIKRKSFFEFEGFGSFFELAFILSKGKFGIMGFLKISSQLAQLCCLIFNLDAEFLLH